MIVIGQNKSDSTLSCIYMAYMAYYYEFKVSVESSLLKIDIARNCSEFETLLNGTMIIL